MHRKKYIRTLKSMLLPYGHWNDDGSKNISARAALLEYYQLLKKVKPDKQYSKGRCFPCHMSYIRYMTIIKSAFDENKLQRVCNELGTLMHQEPFLQPRYYYNILFLLEHYLNIGGNNLEHNI